MQELIELSDKMYSALKQQVEEVSKKADWEELGYRTCVGKVFHRHLDDMKAFEVYCVNQV